MNKTNAIKATGLSLAVIAGSMLAVTVASAHSGTNGEKRQENGFTERFNSEMKEKRKAEREQKQAEHVSRLVKAGTLRQEQADKLMELKEQFKTEMQGLREAGAEREEIRSARQENKAELEAWAEAEGLSLEDIHQSKGEKHSHRGQHGGNREMQSQ